MTPAILQYRAIEHWDGKLPQYSSGALPLLTFDVGKGGPQMDEGLRARRLSTKLLAQTAPPGNATGNATGNANGERARERDHERGARSPRGSACTGGSAADRSSALNRPD